MAAAGADWKKSLTFTDRLTSIQAIATAYRRASPSASYAEAQSHGRRYESEAYDKATSKTEYDRMCQEAIDEADATESVAPVISSPNLPEDEPEEESTEKGIKLGNYQRCLHHADGLVSTVYRSKSEDGTLVALKVVTPHLMNPPHNAKREVQLLREVASPHVIPLLETLDLSGGRLAMVFPFMKYNFDNLLHKEVLTGAQIRSHLRDLFSALAHLHSLGIIHRDVKPSNILLKSPSGPAYLADFGIAWKEGESGSEPASKKIIDVGTTCYRAPEILFGYKEYDTTVDLWAAGCVVAEAVLPNHRQLFDAGPAGTELALIQSIFTTLGTPNEKVWPETTKLPDWGKVEFHEYPGKPWEEVLKGAPSRGRDLTSQLVRYESKSRLSAAEALKHPFLAA